MNSKSYMFLAIALLFVSVKSNSQSLSTPKVKIIEKDTLVEVSPNHIRKSNSKFLELDYFKEREVLLIEEISKLNLQKRLYKESLTSYRESLIKLEKINKEQNEKIKLLEKSMILRDKKRRKVRIRNWTIGIGIGIGTLLLLK